MHDWHGKYVVVEDALAAANPDLWVVSAVADTIPAARALLTVSEPPAQAPRSVFVGEEVDKTLVLRSTPRRPSPQRATIYRLTATGAQVEPAPAAPAREAADVVDRILLDRAGVAMTDQQAYTELNTLGFLGNTAMSAGDFGTAERYFSQSLEIAQRINHPKSIVSTYGSLGALKSQIGDSKTALSLLNDALTIARQNGLLEEEGVSLANLAEAYAAAGDLQRAVDLYLERRQVARHTGDRPAFALSTANLGITYFQMQNYTEALKFLHVAVNEFRTMRMTPELGRALAYLGVTYQANGDVKDCIETYQLHIGMCRHEDDFSTAGTSYLNLSGILFDLGEHDQAISVEQEGYQQMRRLGAPEAGALADKLAAWQA